ncbi:hypothetical protein CEXT_741311 [Caerostris extrusa]|uniref:Uncharacterized protein n=1 Tax=Caerostris extrusa TaxID=172846 RepID=A0AAV4MU42_CAEEX|nr:hypothetical protein CEXT_741311 [Caerostris extrusa]
MIIIQDINDIREFFRECPRLYKFSMAVVISLLVTSGSGRGRPQGIEGWNHLLVASRKQISESSECLRDQEKPVFASASRFFVIRHVIRNGPETKQVI